MLRRSISLLVLWLLASCSSGASLLPPSSGQGRYEGTIRSAAGMKLGTFTLRIDDTGKATGFGDFAAQTVDIRGVLQQGGSLEAFITEVESQETGEFNGTLAGGLLNGTWRFKPDGVNVQTGQWTGARLP